ncbi:MAG: MBL fold metallo-hydrolase, partial [Thermomicrobiales bacterium]
SHHHADHVGGLPGLLHSLANSGHTDRLDIYGPPGTGDMVSALRYIARDLPYEVRVIDVEGGTSVLLANGLAASTVWAEHRVPCLAWRFDLPRAPAFDARAAVDFGIPRDRWSELQRGDSVVIGDVTYVPEQVLKTQRAGLSFGLATDTRPTTAIAELMQDVDLLISEATYAEDSRQELAAANGHMTFREAARMAKESNAKHLWLTHFSARITDPQEHRDLAASIFPNVSIGQAGLTGTLRFETGYEPVSEG